MLRWSPHVRLGILIASLEPPPTFRNLVRRADGEDCTVECRAEFVSQNGERVGLITIIRDITERVRAEHERENVAAIGAESYAQADFAGAAGYGVRRAAIQTDRG